MFCKKEIQALKSEFPLNYVSFPDLIVFIAGQVVKQHGKCEPVLIMLKKERWKNVYGTIKEFGRTSQISASPVKLL